MYMIVLSSPNRVRLCKMSAQSTEPNENNVLDDPGDVEVQMLGNKYHRCYAT